MKHNARIQGDEVSCHICGKAWGIHEDAPECVAKKPQQKIIKPQYLCSPRRRFASLAKADEAVTVMSYRGMYRKVDRRQCKFCSGWHLE